MGNFLDKAPHEVADIDDCISLIRYYQQLADSPIPGKWGAINAQKFEHTAVLFQWRLLELERGQLATLI